MAEVTVYTTTYCPYCIRAKRLLAQKGIAFQEIDVTDDEELRQRMVTESGGRRTVPQIFIGGKSIGGYEELAALEQTGELGRLLGLAVES
jgi:glutaredoxin 3